MRNRIILTALMVVALAITACASAQPQVGRGPVVGVQPVEKVVREVPGAPEAQGGSVSDTAAQPPTTEQMIIRRANLELVVTDTEKTVAEVT
ncbi:MAG: hypothetical protein IT330_09105, partial [Anaerolineae bacterium]|nr:hypothetical protein [Anaerolineae bacterium]